MMIKHKTKGFTLIELLVVIAIIGLLSTLAVVALNNARGKSRDAKRVSDIRSIQTGLELYFADKATYPVIATPGVTLGATTYVTLSSTNGFAATAAGTTYMGKVPANPTPGGAGYVYIGDATTYSITFTLEGPSGDLATGAHTASQTGIQ
ncbi:MAG: hypothetical protein COU72_05045 [Parcubacteria group bacterium CG10_big_fil_rev_8_21_14_0_10_41_35]|nr:MAG: hypothetical protein COU72_05045 [Parcubacteria group bacterium CG10_big_fil_rev_8_21_14_0_10_41_35]PIZ81475.1 MAG: hypothetical protein COY02_01840 [Parcubacteria group bacterium CG_4_10_14_0_2_um_filter_41_6]